MDRMVSLLTFADLLAQYRIVAGQTQEDLADKAGVSVSAISDLERGETRGPQKDTVARLAQALGLTKEQTTDFEAAAARGRARVRRRAPVSERSGGAGGDRRPPTPPKAGSKGGKPEAIARLIGRLAPGGDSGQSNTEHAGDASRGATADILGFASAETLRQAAQPLVRRGAEEINKYVRSLYVARRGVEAEFARFQASFMRPCFLLQGEAGVGKSNQFCRMAWTTSARFPTLLIRGTTHIEGHLGLWEYLAGELHGLGGHQVPAQEIVHVLDQFLRAEDSQLFIFIDGINENVHVEMLKESLAHAVADADGTRIKICLSCRDVDWHLFSDQALLTHRLHRPQASGGQATAGVLMEYFTAEELAEAWSKYTVRYELRVPGDVPPGLATICRHPLMLQFLSEAFHGKAVPQGIHRKEIFDRYWDAKLGSRPEMESALYRLAQALFDAGTTQLPRLDVIELIGEKPFADLLSEQVILYVDSTDWEHMVTFKYDAFHEYVIARFLRRRWRWSMPNADISGNLRELLAMADSYRPKQGAILYLLLSLGARPVAHEFLRHLAGDDARWRIFVCDVLTKLPDADFVAELVPVLSDLCHDDRFPVRWAAANALGIVAQATCPDAARALVAMAASDEWKEREAAALAATHFYRDFSAAEAMLERLADDINWRVRRAVGSSLNHLCRAAQQETFALFWRWVKQPDRWRLRRAVAQAKYGLLRDPDQAIELLGPLAVDAVAEIRWRAVSDLVALMRLPDVRAASLGLLRIIAEHDEDVFTRRHVAFWLPEIVARVGEKCRPLLMRLAADAESVVRWETARALGLVADEALAGEYLKRLAADKSDAVRFAAEYSRIALGLSDRPLAALLASRDSATRLRALRENLARSSRDMETLDKRTDRAADIFSTWTHDRYGIIREVLNKGTSGIASEDLQGFFTLLCDDEDEGIRWAVAGNLADAPSLGTTAVVELLRRLIRDPHYWTRRESASSLGTLASGGALVPSADVVDAVVAASADENPEVRLAALQCLEALHGAEGCAHIEVVEAAIAARRTDEDRQVREYAASIQLRGS